MWVYTLVCMKSGQLLGVNFSESYGWNAGQLLYSKCLYLMLSPKTLIVVFGQEKYRMCLPTCLETVL